VFKDEVLNTLAEHGANVAQFVSFGPDLTLRHRRVKGDVANWVGSVESEIDSIVRSSPEKSVNVRSYQPQDPKSREFVYGLRSSSEAAAHVQRLASLGLYTIVNETVDVADGGVSGVVHGDTIEFAPDDTPRCVEKPGTVGLSRSHGHTVIKTVYGWGLDLPFEADWRVEFSLHPKRRGLRNQHTIIWEAEEQDFPAGAPQTVWPNRFSKLIGDKTFGLLIAWTAGLPVPKTVVVNRRIAPFSFGESTKTGETWIRTAPMVQEPGLFLTAPSWKDPFQVMASADPTGNQIASVLSQESVDAHASGAFTWVTCGGHVEPFVEGVAGFGDDFMLGIKPPESLPDEVTTRVIETASECRQSLGLCRGEWVFDGKCVWVVQLHRLREVMEARVIVPGVVSKFRPFAVADGLEALRALVDSISQSDEGIELVGEVGITSHFGDVLRQARVPSRFASA
jgi:hypothetical protein